MTGFSFETTPRILCEDGAALKLAEFLNGMGVIRPFIVTDAGLVGGCSSTRRMSRLTRR